MSLPCELTEKAGFEKEGVLRRAIYTNGAYADGTIMGLLRPLP